MKRTTAIASLLVGVALVAIAGWVASNTYWTDVKVPMPPKGEALVNPFYAAQRFAEKLGARTAWDRVLTIPPADSVIVLSGWHWNLATRRREALERWVESGGRLVVDATLLGSEEFERWSGISHNHQHLEHDEEEAGGTPVGPCHTFRQQVAAEDSGSSESYRLCDFDGEWSLTSTRHMIWALRDGSNLQAMRVQVGHGSVTAINARPYRYRSLFDGDHAAVFVAAAQLRRGDDVHFVSEEEHPSLLALVWHHGAPVVVLGLVLLGLLLWRGGIRFGPLAAVPHRGRRSLAEQIQGTGRFALRHGGGESLHAATVRALDEAAQRRIGGYARQPAGAGVPALARLTGFDRNELLAAIYHPRLRRSSELRSTIALLEAARRTLIDRTRISHDTQ